MKPEVARVEKNLLELHFPVKDKGFLNLVKEVLWKDKATQLAGFRVTHPEIGKIIFVLKTKGKDAKKVWNDALGRLEKEIDGAKKELAKL